MPWTPKQFKDKHFKAATSAQARDAAKRASAMVKRGHDEGTAIAVAITMAKRGVGTKKGGKK